MMVDLRSDTLTRPTAAMRQAMASAEVGDDQYGEDPTVNLLEEEAAELLGKEAALYVTSGTMGNQLALRTLTRPGDAVIAGARQHLVLYENGAGPLNAGVSWLTTADEGGTLEPEAVERAAVGSDYHMTKATLIAIEDTHMASGGRVWPSKGRAELAAIAAAHGLKVHLDGARIWHAAVASGVTPAAVAADADTVMCCLSKGLGAPIGSLLAGPAEVIEAARFERHRLGGAWRQAGVIAAAGLVALKTMRDRLVDDHARAARLAEAVADRWPEAGLDLATLDTNIVIFGHADPAGLIAYLGTEGIKAGTVAPGRVRFVTHYDVDDAGIDRACQAIAAAPV
jgi:threonine aldolase